VEEIKRFEAGVLESLTTAYAGLDVAVQTRELRIVDGAGRVVARITASAGAGELTLIDAGGERVVRFTASG